MSRNGSGTFTLVSGNPVVTNTTISSTWANNTLADVASALTQSISQDGQTPITANLPMTGFKHTNVALASNLTDYARADQVQNSSMNYLTAVSGTDTITATLASPTLAAYTAGQIFRFVSAGANTGTSVTLNINSLGAKSITKYGATALAVGDIPSGVAVVVIYDGTQFQLLNVNKAGTAANNQVFLDATGKLPAVDGSQLTNVGSTSKIQSITASVATNALTATYNGGTLDFRSATLASGTVSTIVVGSISLTVASGATLGTTNNLSARLVLAAINNAGTAELAIANLSGLSTLDESQLISTTALSGTSNSSGVWYSTTARSNVAYRIVGYLDISEATAGTWATSPTVIQGAGQKERVNSSVVNGTAVASTSGTSIDFTGIPSWAKRVTLILNGVSTNGTSNPLIQLGSGSVQTTGYLGASSACVGANTVNVASYTTGFGIVSGVASNVFSGQIIFDLISANNWICAGVLGFSSSSATANTGGSVSLSGTLDRVRFTTVNGTDAFDAGSVNIMWE